MKLAPSKHAHRGYFEALIGYVAYHTKMPLFARIFFIAFTSFAGSCSIQQAQIESERKDIGRELTGAYCSCVQTAFASQCIHDVRALTKRLRQS